MLIISKIDERDISKIKEESQRYYEGRALDLHMANLDSIPAPHTVSQVPLVVISEYRE